MPMLDLLFLILTGLTVYFGLKKKFVALTITSFLLIILIGFWIWAGTQVIIN